MTCYRTPKRQFQAGLFKIKVHGFRSFILFTVYLYLEKISLGNLFYDVIYFHRFEAIRFGLWPGLVTLWVT